MFAHIRLIFYEYGILKSYSFDIPIISVGNISMGGTGKTPMVGWLINELISYNKKPCIITRGYNRKSDKMVVINGNKNNNYTVNQIGDEPLSIIKEYPSVSMVVGSNKISSINRAIKELDIDVIIMDDGFQSLYIKRDLDILMVNVKDNHGITREGQSSINRADVVIFKPSDNTDNSADKILTNLNNKIIKMRAKSVFSVAPPYHINNIKNMGPVIAVCGIADSDSFKKALDGNEIKIHELLKYKNHHNYTNHDIDYIYRKMIGGGCKSIITTSKDYYKLSALNKKMVGIIVLKINFDFEKHPDDKYNNRVELINLLKRVMAQ